MSWKQVRDCGLNLITPLGRKRSRIGCDIGGGLLDLVLNLKGLAEKSTKDRTAGTGESTSLRCQGSHSVSLCIKRVENGSGITGNNCRGKYDGKESAEGEDDIVEGNHIEVGSGEMKIWGEDQIFVYQCGLGSLGEVISK